MPSRFNDIERAEEFKRDLKKLLKRYRTLEEDIDTLINASLYAFHKLDIDTGGIFRLQGLGFEEPAVYKVKKFACRSLKGKGNQTGLRLIYSYLSEADRVVLIELYYKGDKDNEDRSRTKRLYGDD